MNLLGALSYPSSEFIFVLSSEGIPCWFWVELVHSEQGHPGLHDPVMHFFRAVRDFVRACISQVRGFAIASVPQCLVPECATGRRDQ